MFLRSQWVNQWFLFIPRLRVGRRDKAKRAKCLPMGLNVKWKRWIFLIFFFQTNFKYSHTKMPLVIFSSSTAPPLFIFMDQFSAFFFFILFLSTTSFLFFLYMRVERSSTNARITERISMEFFQAFSSFPLHANLGNILVMNRDVLLWISFALYSK